MPYTISSTRLLKSFSPLNRMLIRSLSVYLPALRPTIGSIRNTGLESRTTVKVSPCTAASATFFKLRCNSLMPMMVFIILTNLSILIRYLYSIRACLVVKASKKASKKATRGKQVAGARGNGNLGQLGEAIGGCPTPLSFSAPHPTYAVEEEHAHEIVFPASVPVSCHFRFFSYLSP